MPKVCKKRFPCGHRGFGKFCHRCNEADKLENLAKSGKKYTTHKKPNKATGKKQPKKWTKEEILEEVKRLRNEDKKF